LAHLNPAWSGCKAACCPSTARFDWAVRLALCAAELAKARHKSALRNQPDPLPAILLGQLAVDRRYQNLGYARSLMWFALATSVRFSKDVGCFGVLTHPLDDDLRVFYRRFGFEDLPFDPGRAMVVRIADLERNGFALNNG